MKRATVTVEVTDEHSPGPYSGYSVEGGMLSLSIIEKCNTDLDVARLLKRLAVMVHPKVDQP